MSACDVFQQALSKSPTSRQQLQLQPILPVGAPRGQKVLIGVEFNDVDWPRVSRELRHDLSSSQVPQLGRERTTKAFLARVPTNFTPIS